MSEEIKLMKVSYAELQNKLIECNTDRIRLQQENQQLKEQLKDENNYHNEAVKWYKEAFEIEQERIKYRNVLDEIRERIEFFMEDGRGSLLELLEILDKVRE